MKVVKGRLTELNGHHVYDWIGEVDIPKGTKIETSRWVDNIKPRDSDDTSALSCSSATSSNASTPPLKVLRMLLALATSKDSHRRKV